MCTVLDKSVVEFVWFYPHWTMWKSVFCVQPLYPPNIWYSKAFIYSSILISYKCVVICETKCVPKWLQRNSIVLLSHIQKIRFKFSNFSIYLVFLKPQTFSLIVDSDEQRLRFCWMRLFRAENWNYPFYLRRMWKRIEPCHKVWRIKEKSYEITYILSNDI